MSFLYLSVVESEIPIRFAIRFWVNFRLFIFLPMNLNNKFCLYGRNIELESNCSDLQAHSIVTSEDISYKQN